MNGINAFFMFASLLLFISVLASTLSARMGFPLLLLFLTVGMLAGEDGIGHLQFDDFFLAGMLGQAALGVILLDGGLRTRYDSFRVALKPAGVLASVGVLITVALLGFSIVWYLDLAWPYAFLLAAIVGSTDAAAVFSLLGNSGIRLNRRVRSTLEVESGANDPMAILLVMVFMGLLQEGQGITAGGVIGMFMRQLGVGALFGYFGGKFLAWLMSRLKLTDSFYPLLILSGGMLVFTLSNLLGGSGFLSVYWCGIMVGNCRSRMTDSVLQVMDGMAWLSQASMFVVLGLLVSPSEMITYGSLALGVALIVTFIARPIAVWICLLPFHFSRREVAFISWVGLKGAVPVILAMMPAMMGVEHSALFFNVAFAVVLLSLLVQGMSLPFVARLFKMVVPSRYEPDEKHEVWLSAHESLPLYAFQIVPQSAADGVFVRDLSRLLGTDEIDVVAVLNNDEKITLNRGTRLISGEKIWVSMSDAHIEKVARFCTDVGEEMQHRQQFFGEFSFDADEAIGTLAVVYGLSIASEEHKQSIAYWLQKRLGEDAVVGDRFEIDGFSLIVSQINKGKIQKVGFKLPA